MIDTIFLLRHAVALFSIWQFKQIHLLDGSAFLLEERMFYKKELFYYLKKDII